MLDFIYNLKMSPELAFLMLVLITIYYIRSKQFEERNIGLIACSFFQGLIGSLVFPKYFLYAPVLALIYYLLAINFWNIIFSLNAYSGKLKDYSDKELIHNLKKIPEIENLKFDFKRYSGKNSLNAFTLPKNWIILGDDLISKFTIAEKIFVVSHEAAHILEKHQRKKSIISFIVLICLVFITLILNSFIVYTLKEVDAYLLISFSIFITGIIALNLISWQVEYDADKKGLQLTKDKKSLELAFAKLKGESYNRDYGMIINLIVYDHPLIKNRIKRSKNLVP